jgi:hypothetical protein
VDGLVKARRLDEFADRLDLTRLGPDPRTALTDPALFEALLRDARTKMHLLGCWPCRRSGAEMLPRRTIAPFDRQLPDRLRGESHLEPLTTFSTVASEPD